MWTASAPYRAFVLTLGLGSADELGCRAVSPIERVIGGDMGRRGHGFRFILATTGRPRRSYPIGLYFGVFGVLLAVSTGIGIWYARAGAERQATTDAHKDAIFGAAEAAEEISSKLSALEHQLVATAGSPAVTAVLAAPEGCTLAFTGVGPFSSGHLDFLGSDGTVACTSLVMADAATPASPSRGYVDAEWLVASDGPVLTGPVVDSRTGELVVISVVPVPGHGFVAAFLDLESLGAGLADRFAGRLALEFVVTTADGAQILTRSLDSERWVGAPTGAVPFDVAAGDSTRSDVDGVERIYGDATVSDLGWRVFAGAGRDDALEGATSAFRRALVVIAVALLLMLSIAGLIYRRIAGPIKSLSRAVGAQAVEGSQGTIAVRGPTEVIDVADAFNELFENLRRELGDRKRAEQTAQDSERSYRTLFEDNPQPMWISDVATFEFLAVNDAAVAHYGYSRSEFLAMGIRDIVAGEHGDGTSSAELHELHRLHGANVVGPPHRSGPWRHITRDGAEISVEITSHTIRFGGREARFALAVDVTERLAYEAQLQHLALHDELTGLANRTLLLDRLSSAIAQAPRHMATVGVLYLDLDHFKPVNDIYGHAAGDEVLRALASRLTETARPGDTVARIGGDEFVVLCPELVGETEAISVAGRIEGVLATPFQIGNAEVVLTASIGVIMSTGAGTADELLRDADAAMYRAKERGGNRFEIFEDDIRTRTLTRLQTGNELRDAIRAGELRVYYQPEIDLRTGTCSGVEALVRWQHPTRGLLAPVDFIPLAEENGLIVPLGAWVLRTACRQAAEWRNENNALRTVSVNLSAKEIAQPDLVTRVSEALDQAGLDPSALRLEITETSIMEDPQGAGEILASLRDLGVRLDIDDFGTGYSSLLYLRRYAVDFLKIDRSFVAGLGQNPQDDAIVASVIDLAHAFGIRVVAEGVETIAQATLLRNQGCDFGQGFLWARPVPASELPAAFRHIDTLNRELIRTE